MALLDTTVQGCWVRFVATCFFENHVTEPVFRTALHDGVCSSATTMNRSNSLRLPPEVIRLIISASQIPLLYLWAVTAKWTRFWAGRELRNRHTDILKLFFKDPDVFLEGLGRFDGIIAGPVALAYFEGHPGIWPNTCNIHIPFQHYETFLAYVQDVEEYVVDNSPKALLKNQEMVLGTQLVRFYAYQGVKHSIYN